MSLSYRQWASLVLLGHQSCIELSVEALVRELLHEFGEEHALLLELVCKCSDLFPAFFVVTGDHVDGRLADLRDELLDADEDLRHELSYFRLFPTHEASVQDSAVEIVGGMKLVKLLEGLNRLHGLVEPLPGGFDGIYQKVLGKCVHEALHLETPK